MNYSPLILIIDDEVAILQTLKESLQDEGFRANVLSDGNKALSLIGELVPDLVLLDVFMPNCNGLELLGKIKKEYPAQKVMIISGFGNVPLAVDAIKNGAIDFIEKPFNFDDILSKLNFLKNNQRKIKAVAASAHSIADLKSFGIVGESFLFQELMTQVKNVAQLKFPLLIYGEHGTGKTLISSFIHETSVRQNKPFTIIDCSVQNLTDLSIRLLLNPGASPMGDGSTSSPRARLSNDARPEPVEGYEFQKRSIYDLSGTIVLKNIDGLTSEGQRKLLEYLGSSEYKDMLDADQIKVIATSSKPLFNLMRSNQFNSTLFYKLNITPIEVPSINKRRYDIPLLINYFLSQFNQIFNKNITLDAECVRFLRNRHWVGNIAEIKTMLERVIMLATHENARITSGDLHGIISEREVEFVEEQSFLSFGSFNEAALAFEKKYLLYILRKSNFDLQQTSEKLGLSVNSLSEKIAALKISFKNLISE